jgi:alkylation response protein AidB-like acyl-CoA dehydrogenase
MATQYHDRRTINFLLYDVHEVEKACQLPFFSDHSRETFEMTLDAATLIADNIMFPNLLSVDRNQPELVDGEVKVHPCLKDYLKALGESGIIGADFTYEDGGAQLPFSVSNMVGHILMAANNGMMYTGLTTGAARLIANFGSDELKQKYIPDMLNGNWQGTMCLTEPQAGSSLSDIVCTAEPAGENEFLVSGQKIFISAGDHDACRNVVHLVLARIKGAPLGTKGISLFVVPKYFEDGSKNDITNMGIYHKLGQKGVPAMHLGFGDQCRGYLLGEPNKGLSYMFQMMNEARIGVGSTGASIASAAYHAAVEYTKERPQSRRLNKKNALDSPQIPIIQHPDIRRMLLFQKAAVEGSLSLLTEVAQYFDLSHYSTSEEERKKYHLLLELLTPIAKTYPCESGLRVTSDALQCFGGYGFTEDFPIEQYYRDIRITPIYEGTTGIQSQDLLGRKVIAENGAALKLLAGEIQKTIDEAMAYDHLKKYANELSAEIKNLSTITRHLISVAATGDTERFLSDATLYMELSGLVTIAWQWLKIGVVAQKKPATSDDLKSFYESKIHTMKFFYHYELPKTSGLSKRLLDEEVLTIDQGTDFQF